MPEEMLSEEARKNFSLADYDVSYVTGFASEDPLEILPPYFEPWNTLAKSIPELLEKHTFREHADKLPQLDHKRLNGNRELRLANTQLAVMTAAYVWQEGPTGLPKCLPACLAVPYWGVSQDVGLPPTITYSNLFLSNWKKIDPKGGLELENLHTIYHFSRHPEVEKFMILTDGIEMDFGIGARGIEEGVRSIANEDDDGLIEALAKIQTAVETLLSSFKTIHGHVSPDVFVGKLMPFFQGFGHDQSPCKDGLVFEGVSELPIKTERASGAQTPIIQSVDAFLGLETHEASVKMKHLMRIGMTPLHTKFLETLERLPSAKDYVEKTSNEDLRAAFDECLAALVKFRSYHIQIVTKYAVMGVNKMKKQLGIVDPTPTPPGGAYPIPILKQIRNEVREQKI